MGRDGGGGGQGHQGVLGRVRRERRRNPRDHMAARPSVQSSQTQARSPSMGPAVGLEAQTRGANVMPHGQLPTCLRKPTAGILLGKINALKSLLRDVASGRDQLRGCRIKITGLVPVQVSGGDCPVWLCDVRKGCFSEDTFGSAPQGLSQLVDPG